METYVKDVPAEQGLSPEERAITARWARQIFSPMESTRHYTWTKEWRFIILVYSGGEPVSSLRIVERIAFFDGKPVKVGGIAGVMTPPEHRRKGFASLGLREAKRVIYDELGAQLGLLLCDPDLVPFYSRHGWQLVECPLHFDQPGGKAIWPEKVMILSRPTEQWTPKTIDLRGLPW